MIEKILEIVAQRLNALATKIFKKVFTVEWRNPRIKAAVWLSWLSCKYVKWLRPADPL